MDAQLLNNALSEIRAYVKKRGCFPPDSLVDIECSHCHHFDTHSCVREEDGFSLQCPSCMIKSFHNLPLYILAQRKIKKLSISVSLVLIVALFGFYKTDLVEVLKKGPKFSKLFFASDTYERAWALYQQGELDEPQRICTQLLESESGRMLAKVETLLGHINEKRGRVEEALTFYQLAIDFYEANNDFTNLGYVFSSIATLSLNSSDFGNCRAYIDLASECFQQGKPRKIDLLRLSYIEFDLLRGEGFYEEANEMAMDIYRGFSAEGYDRYAAYVLSDLAAIKISLGFYKEAVQKTLEAGSIFLERGDTEDYYFNLVNFIMLEKCRNGEWEIYRDQIMSYAEKNDNSRIIEEVKKALKIVCQDTPLERDSRVGGNNEPPPPDDGSQKTGRPKAAQPKKY